MTGLRDWAAPRLALAWLAFAAILALGELATWLETAATTLAGLDFVGFYATARVYLEQGSPAVFDPARLAAAQQRIAAAWGGQPFLPDLYPPFWVLAQSWLGLLPLVPAYLAWGALTIAAGGVALVLLARTQGDQEGLDRRWAVVVAAGFLPLWVNLLQGQSDAFPLLGAALAYALWRAGREGLAGLALGLLLVKPQLGFLLLLLPFLHRSGRAIAGLAAAAAGLSVLSLAAFGPGGLAAWARFIAEVAVASTGGATFRPWLSLRGPLVALGLPAGLQYGLLAALALALAVALALRRRDLAADFSLAVVGALLVTPHLNFHDLSLLVVPGILLAGPAGRRLPGGVAYLAGTLAIWVAPAAILGSLGLLWIGLRSPDLRGKAG